MNAIYLSTAALSLALASGPAREPSVQTIIERSVAANQKDFAAAPHFNNKEKDRTEDGGSKTFQITMIDGTPYQRLLAINEKPIPAAQAAEEMKKEQAETARRHSESPTTRARRIADFDKERKRDQAMLGQLTKGFDFQLTGNRAVNGRKVWVLKATPKPGYKPPNMESQVLPGMEGELWIDQRTFEWVKVTAQVIHPVSIEGFLARVEPGTRFEIEKSPIAGGTWQINHFSMQSRAKVLFLVNHNSADEEWYFDFKRAR